VNESVGVLAVSSSVGLNEESTIQTSGTSVQSRMTASRAFRPMRLPTPPFAGFIAQAPSP
jgi:hypothetical protein